jgi:hypothetical protein
MVIDFFFNCHKVWQFLQHSIAIRYNDWIFSIAMKLVTIEMNLVSIAHKPTQGSPRIFWPRVTLDWLSRSYIGMTQECIYIQMHPSRHDECKDAMITLGHSSDIRSTRIFWRCSKRNIFKYLKMWIREIREYDEQNAEQAELKLCPNPS